ncbi:MAG: DNA starvation/stationary phase protection protein Dps [Candidatus Binatia bacterium]
MTNRSGTAAVRRAEPAGRAVVVAELNRRLADSIDLHAQVKVAHWNVKGPHFAALHPLFEQFAVALAARIDQVAERAVTLGGAAEGTLPAVAQRSALPAYDTTVRDGLGHARQLAERFAAYVEGLRASRQVAEAAGDADTVDLLTQVVSEFEKFGWFLEATVE